MRGRRFSCVDIRECDEEPVCETEEEASKIQNAFVGCRDLDGDCGSV